MFVIQEQFRLKVVPHKICVQVNCFFSRCLFHNTIDWWSDSFTVTDLHWICLITRSGCSLKRNKKWKLLSMQYIYFFHVHLTEVVIFILFKFQFRSINCALFASVFQCLYFQLYTLHFPFGQMWKREKKREKKVFF